MNFEECPHYETCKKLSGMEQELHEVKAAVTTASAARAENRQDVKDIHKKIDLFHGEVVGPLNKVKSNNGWIIAIGGSLLGVAMILIAFLYGHSEKAHDKIADVNEDISAIDTSVEGLKKDIKYMGDHVRENKDDTKYLIKYLKGETNGN